MSGGQLHYYKLNFRVKKGYTNVVIAQCLQYPGIILQIKSLFDLRKKIITAIDGYFKAFPDKLDEFIEKYMVPVKDAEHKEKIDLQIEEQDKVLLEMQEAYDKISHDWQELEQVVTITR